MISLASGMWVDRFGGQRGPSWRPLVLFLLLSLLFLAVAQSVSAEEDDEFFSCTRIVHFRKKKNETAAIIPMKNINVEVGKEPKEVLCRFNSKYIDAEEVYFFSKNRDVPHQIVNSTTISTKIQHSEPQKYLLSCKRKNQKNGKDVHLCKQYVIASTPPLDVENFVCISFNNLNVNCSWTTPKNLLPVTYVNVTYASKSMREVLCIDSNSTEKNWCFWNRSLVFKLDDEFTLKITMENEFGVRSYTHKVYIPEIVIPDKVSSNLTLIKPLTVNVTWTLPSPMDVFHFGLFHSVQKRMKGEDHWHNVTNFFYIYNISQFNNLKTFYIIHNLTYPNTEYEFRVRLHSGVSQVKDHMWSSYDIISVSTKPLPPRIPPKVSKSSFEVVEGLEMRDIFVNFEDLSDLERGGPGFHYNVDVYSPTNNRVDVQPTEITEAYIKYHFMNFTQYKFRITPANNIGPSEFYSDVIVPNSDCMPKKTEMFTVITSSLQDNMKFSLYWVPSRMPNELCPGSTYQIDSYTIFWCRRTTGYRCKKKLKWKKIGVDGLMMKDLRRFTTANITIYEHNITDFSNNELYSFGVAANSGDFSSGIRWSSCIVDDKEPPQPPVTQLEALTNDSESVLVKWKLKCMSISAVPVGFNVSYCKSSFADFGHCISAVQHVELNSPTASEALISNLDAGMSYIFSVSVLSIIGEGSQSYPRLMKLREDIPDYAVKNLWVQDFSNTSVSLMWELPDEVKNYATITIYQISSFPHIRDNIFVPAPHSAAANVSYTLKNLKPFTTYDLSVIPCNPKGCGIKKKEIQFKTKPGVPDNVENFILDANTWHLMWDLKHCNSRNCSFEIEIPVNETDYKTVVINDKETLNLYKENVTCNKTHMEFRIRAKGQDLSGNFLYGNWMSTVKQPSECPPVPLSWWIICIIVIFCVIFSAIVMVIVKLGWRTIIKGIKDCNQNINLPKGIQVAEHTKEPLKDFSTYSSKVPCSNRDSEPPLLLLPTPPQRQSVDRGSGKFRADSVSSEEVQLIDAVDHDRHGRNFSGSSDHSSGQDSALMSGCPSLNNNPNDQMDNLSSEHSNQETTLRQRSPGPPYVQHGIIPDKMTEGYVTAWSVPSLPHLYKEGLDSIQQSTPDLNESLFTSGWQKNARRASTGYISMPDSDNDKESPSRGAKDALTEVALSSRAPQSAGSGGGGGLSGYTSLPHYSRHSFSPEVQMESAKGGYVILAEGRSPSPPTNGGNVGYVSAGDPFGSLKRPPSLPLIPKSISAGDNELPVGAYCRVGSRGNSANHGYVSASRVGELISQQDLVAQGDKNPPYVSCGEAASMSYNSANAAHKDISSSSLPPPAQSFSPYVEIKDGGRWANPVHSRVPTMTSAPAQGIRVGALPRPNTTEATMGHPRGSDKNPSLSKQSSGYVSQETIAAPEGMLMSPKRLMTQTTAPHNVVLANNHQASMV